MVIDTPDQLSALLPFVEKLEGHVPLSSLDREAILSLPHSVRSLHAGAHVFREGESTSHCCVVLSGFACKHKILPDGSRQILSVHMRGDAVDLQNALIPVPDYNLQTLKRSDLALIPAPAISDVIETHPAVARAMWIETLLEARIQREWTVNVGRRDARTRIAHLLCELGIRLEAAHLGKRSEYGLPLTQEQIADATSLTAVHVNRTIQSLRADELLARDPHIVTIGNWDALADVGDFKGDYLHLRHLPA